jgi:carbon-monoxide dehydrogenase medium subunit
VEIPRFSPQARWGYRKACRKPGEFAEAIGAVLLDPTRDVARAVIGALDRMPRVIDGAERVALLASAAGLARTLDAIEFDDVYERELHAAMLRRAYADATAGRA